MPLNDYACARCGKKFEALKDQQYIKCMYCHSMAERQFPLPARTRVGKYGKAGGIEPETSKED
jgi:predicted nucleic acid-binding Zn ribbon protein